MPWKLHQNYTKDLLTLWFGSVDDGAMEFAGTGIAAGAAENVAG